MPRLLKTAEKTTVTLTPEDQLLLLFRTYHGSWRAVLAWLREQAPRRLSPATE